MQWHRLLIGYYTQNICDCTRCGVGLSIAVLLYGFHIFGGADKCKIPACCCRKEIIFASLLISSTRYVANDHSLHYIFKSTSTNHDAFTWTMHGCKKVFWRCGNVEWWPIVLYLYRCTYRLLFCALCHLQLLVVPIFPPGLACMEAHDGGQILV